DGFAAQLRIISLFDGSVERIHIDMDDLALTRRAGRDLAVTRRLVGRSCGWIGVRREHPRQPNRRPCSVVVSPRARIVSLSSGEGRCSAVASFQSTTGQVSISFLRVRITGMAPSGSWLMVYRLH